MGQGYPKVSPWHPGSRELKAGQHRSAKPCVSPRAPQNAAAGAGRRCPDGERSSGRGAAGKARGWLTSRPFPREQGPSRSCVKRCRPGWTLPEASTLHSCPPFAPETCREPGQPPAHGLQSQARPCPWALVWASPQPMGSRASPQPTGTGTGGGSLGAAVTEHPQSPPQPLWAWLQGLGKAQGPRPTWDTLSRVSGQAQAQPTLGQLPLAESQGSGISRDLSGSAGKGGRGCGVCWDAQPKAWLCAGHRSPLAAESQAQQEPEEGGKCNCTLPDHFCNL